MNGIASRYWAFQLGGWGLFALINTFWAITFNQFSPDVLKRLLFFVLIGIAFSHLMRTAIVYSNLLMKKQQEQIISFILFTFVFSFFIASIQTYFEITTQVARKAYFELFLNRFTMTFPLIFIWNCIYFIYHYVMKSRKQQMDTLQLEALVKELELKTIKAHINPHFIFNALNGIRALIDENPDRARTAVTELSNILRSSLSAEKSETVPLKDELRIVRDYLALENMRFEDRLKVE
ncbi:MAG TPA: histidine kinase, partial [Chitinophagaceae bacterium]|nr:histidine kinase [Chitinophagaceae bacterium]